MRVLRRRRAVRRPACVSDPGQRSLVLDLRREVVDAGDGPGEVDRAVAQHRDAAGVVAAVFEAPQPFYEDRHDVPARGRAHNPAHSLTPFSSVASTTAPTPAGHAPR